MGLGQLTPGQGERPWLEWGELERVAALPQGQMASFLGDAEAAGLVEPAVDPANTDPFERFTSLREGLAVAFEDSENVAAQDLIPRYALRATVLLNARVNEPHTGEGRTYRSVDEIREVAADIAGLTVEELFGDN